jgi:predicted phosphodiesterase
MIVAIISDIHGNLPALEQCVRRTRPFADRYLCLGDVVNYGPWSDECLDLVLSLPEIVLLEGNHERIFRGDEPIDHEIPLVQAFTRHSLQWFSRADRIAGLPKEWMLGTYRCVHTIDNRNVYANTEIDVDSDIILGHSHQQFQIARCGHTIVNPGSVGQNRGCIDVVSYALFDTETSRVTLCEETYPVDLFLRELRARRYPEECVNYYARKQRKTSPWKQVHAV